MDIPRLHRELRKLEKMRATAFNRWHEWMDGAWGQDPSHPLPMRQAGREMYKRYLDLDAEAAVVRNEMFSRFRPQRNARAKHS